MEVRWEKNKTKITLSVPSWGYFTVSIGRTIVVLTDLSQATDVFSRQTGDAQQSASQTKKTRQFRSPVHQGIPAMHIEDDNGEHWVRARPMATDDARQTSNETRKRDNGAILLAL